MDQERANNEQDVTNTNTEKLCSRIEHLKGVYDEAIVILGRGISSGYEGTGKTPWIGRLREIAGVITFYDSIRDGKSPVIIITGGLEDNNLEGPTTEASIMKEELLKYEIPEDTIIMDEEAYETSTNAENVSKILDTLGFLEKGKVKLITNKFHLKRSDLLFKKYFSGEIEPTSAEKVIIEFDEEEEKYKLPGDKIKKPYREFSKRFLNSFLNAKLTVTDYGLKQVTKSETGEAALRKIAKKLRLEEEKESS